MITTTDKQAEKQTIEWAKEIVAHHTKLEDQKNQLCKLVFGNKQLIKEITKQAVTSYCLDHIYKARHAIVTKTHETCKSKFAQIKMNNGIRSQAITQSILNTYPCGDKVIGDCTFAEVKAQMELHKANAIGNQIKAHILGAIAKLGKPTEIVRKKVSEKQIQKIIGTKGKKAG